MIRLVPPPRHDIVLTLACVAAMYGEVAVRHLTLSPWQHITLLLTATPVLLRRQAPAVSLVLAFVFLFVLADADGGFYNVIPGPAVLCAHEVAGRWGRRQAMIAGAAGLPATLAILQIYSPHALISWGTAQNLALVVLPLSLGVAGHERRAATAALVERARAAEHNQEETARRRVSEERLRIAREVHDVVAHALVTINVQAGVGAYLVHGDPDQAHTSLRTIKQLSGDALNDLRATLGVLREGESASGTPVQGLAALDDLAAGMRAAGLDLTLAVDRQAGHLPAAVDTTAYRIVQEAMTNTLKHAGPTRVRVSLTRRGDRLLIEITDQGGTPAERFSGSGNGLRGMRERVTALGGSLRAGRHGAGWQVSAELPVDAAVVALDAVDGRGGVGAP